MVNLEELISRALYRIPTERVNTPDVEQSAAYFYQELQVQKLTLEQFTEEYLNFLSQEAILEACIYPGVIDELSILREECRKKELELSFLSWTQGNLLLQSQKAELFQKKLPPSSLTSPSIYAALNKIQILSTLVQDLQRQKFDFLVLIDDRANNLLQAEAVLKQTTLKKYLILQKIRADKPSQKKTEAFLSIRQISELLILLKENFPANSKLALVLDKDGVIYDTTKYRKILEKALLEFLV